MPDRLCYDGLKRMGIASKALKGAPFPVPVCNFSLYYACELFFSTVPNVIKTEACRSVKKYANSLRRCVVALKKVATTSKSRYQSPR
jgi:hypothetical protein